MKHYLSQACLVAALVVAGFGISGTTAHAAAPPMNSIQESGGWDAPPPELDEVSRRGFHDGIEGAHKDWENHRRPTPENRDEFRHPPVPHRDRQAYRDGFRRGYEHAFDHWNHEQPR
jgi:hypothetical protein